MIRLVLKRVTYKNFSSLNRNLRSHSTPGKCPLTILKCPLSVLWRCPSYREFGWSKMTEKRPGPAPAVRLIEVSVKREFTVPCFKTQRIGSDLHRGREYIPRSRFFHTDRLSSVLWQTGTI